MKVDGERKFVIITTSKIFFIFCVEYLMGDNKILWSNLKNSHTICAVKKTNDNYIPREIAPIT